MLDADPTNVKLQSMLALATAVKAEVNGIAGPAAAAPALAQGLIDASAGVDKVKAGTSGLVNGVSALGWPGTVALADAKAGTAVEDGSLVLGNLMNAAHALGVGSCWIHRAREEFASGEGKALLKRWGIEGDWVGVGHCILGYAAEPAAPAKPRKADYIVRV